MAKLLASVVAEKFTDNYTAKCSEKDYTPYSNEGARIKPELPEASKTA